MNVLHACLIFMSIILSSYVTAQCPTAPLFSFLQNSTVTNTMFIAGVYNLSSDGLNSPNVLSGAFVPMRCNPGYVLASGQLNITCIGNTWTPLPTCVLNNPNGNNGATTMAMSSGAGCSYDEPRMITLENGFRTASSITYVTQNTVTGSIQFDCLPGFALDPSIGSTQVCNNGQWSPKPRCLMTGRCQFAQLQNFISTASGIQTTGQSSIRQPANDQSTVLNGSFIVFSCVSGFVNTGGSLNVTCGNNNMWSPFPNCVQSSGGGPMTTISPGGAMPTTTMPMGSGAACLFDATTMFNIDNGFRTGSLISYVTQNTVTGSIQFDCLPGFVLDPSIGSTQICNNGQWSPKPRCLMTGRCQFAQLQNFISTATNIQTTGQSSLRQPSNDQSTVFNGSFIVFSCANGFVNAGGSLNVTCGNNNMWSPFPNCVQSSGGGGMPTTTMPMGGGAACFFDASTMFNIDNGFRTGSSISYVTQNTVTGSIQFDCLPGFVLDPSVGSMQVCNNGQWSPKPRCLMTGRCQFAQLQNFISTATNIQTTGQSRLQQMPNDQSTVLNGSFIVFSCINGFVNAGGSLNVTCGNNNMWSPFPNCVQSSGGGGMPTTTMPMGGGAACFFDVTTMFNIDNGFRTGSSISYVTQNTVTGSIQFDCLPGFVLDPSVGSTQVCNNGQWSPKPRCLMTSRCQFAQLQNFINTAAGIQTTGQSSLRQATNDQSTVLNGSFIVLSCISGFVNAGGSLNVTCGNNNMWSPFPNCVQSSGGGGMPTTTMPMGGGAACFFDAATMFNIDNGFRTGSSIGYVTQNTVTGSIQFDCLPGFVLDPSVGSMQICNNGQWSPKPRCLMTGRCQFAQLQNFINTAAGIQTTGQSSLRQATNDQSTVLNGSFIVLSCISGFVNAGGSLNVTCGNNNMWSPFPNCIQSSGGGSMTTMGPGGGIMTTTTMPMSGGAGCVFDQATIFTLTNGFTTGSVITPVTQNTVTGSIQFDCLPGFVLDPSIGRTQVCNNGQWSPKPRCLMTGRCSFSQLQNFLSTASGIQISGLTSLRQLPTEPGVVLNGSFVVFSCMSGYVNTGGSLNLTCGDNGMWSPLPNCVLSSQGTMASTTRTPAPATTVSNQPTATCVDIPTVANAIVANATALQRNNMIFSRSVEYRCNPGFVHLEASGRRFVSCTDGRWDPLPMCIESATCSAVELQGALLVGMSVQSHTLRMSNTNNRGVLPGGWMNINCVGNYRWNPASGPLNITCLSTGRWTPFPVCIL